MMNQSMYKYDEKLFIKARVANITFDGIDDPLLHMADQDVIPIDIPFDRFGWFYSVSCTNFTFSSKKYFINHSIKAIGCQ